jgi:hypothetical protein
MNITEQNFSVTTINVLDTQKYENQKQVDKNKKSVSNMKVNSNAKTN